MLICLALMVLGCGRGKAKGPAAQSGETAAVSAPAGPIKPTGPFVANPPRLDQIPDGTTISVSVSYGKLRFPIAGRDSVAVGVFAEYVACGKNSFACLAQSPCMSPNSMTKLVTGQFK